MNVRRTSLIGPLLGLMLPGLAPSAAAASTRTVRLTAPGQHTFVVPPAVSTLSVLLVGGNGGDGSGFIPGGTGATLSAILTVRPGERLYPEVGGNGEAATSGYAALGGYNGGGTGGSQIFFSTSASGGGGGGASDIRTIPYCPPSNPSCGSLASRLVVAAGGGGGGGSTPDASAGNGGAADADGFDGYADPQGDTAGTRGLRGTLLGGGPAGTGAGTPGSSTWATAGTLGWGGNGAETSGGGGGGGGGGIYGGGGGGSGNSQLIGTLPNVILKAAGGGGAGGGSSSQPPGSRGVTGITLRPTASGAHPEIVLSWRLPRPTVRTQPATLVRSRTAVVHGTVNPNAAHVTSCYFTIQPATAAGSRIYCPQQLGSGASPLAVSAHLFGLRPATKYAVRLMASNAQGITRGALVTFTTRRRG